MGNYTKEVRTSVVIVHHTVRIKLNEPLSEVLQSLQNIPPDAVVSMIIGDDKLGDYDKIRFVEEQLQ